MDKLNEKLDFYRQSIKQVLTAYASYQPSYGDIEIQTLFDEKHDHYQVLGVGWQDKKRVYGCSIHLDIKDNKIWLQVNNTELDIAQQLVELGVPKENLVIGFQTPTLRKYSGYAVC